MAIAKNGEENKALGLSGALLTPEEEKKKEQEAAATAPAPSTQPSTAPTTATQTAPAVKPIPTQQKAGTGTFANLKSYLEANKGSKVASATAQRIEKATTGAQKTLGQTQSQFQQQMQAGSLANQEQALKDIQGIVGAARGVTYQAPQPQQTEPTQDQTPAPAQTYLAPDQQERFKEVITAQYAGPYALQEIGSYGELQKRAQEAGTLASQAQDISTRADLLRNVFGRGREYTSGQAKLDELLLGQTEQGVQNIQQKAQQAADVKRQLQAAGIEKATEASQRERDIANIQQEARKEFLTQRSSEETATQNRIDDLIKNPALDENGKKIPKLDANGRPIKINGVVQYQTEWDRLPEYFKGLLSEKSKKEAAEKAIKEQESALYGQYRGTISKRANTLKDIKKLEEDLKKYEQQAKMVYDPSTSSGGFGFYDPNQQRRLAEQEKARIDKLVAYAQKQLGILNPKLEETRKLLAGIESGKYADYQKALEKARQMSKEQLLLSPEEAAVLGIRAGEGLYKLGPEAIKAAKAKEERLVTKDEVARQLALAELAALDPTQALKKGLLYSDLKKAGTQNLASSLDVKGFQDALKEQQKAFAKSVAETELVGRGKKKVSRGGMFGTKTRTYTAEQKAKVADLLESAGIDTSKLDSEQMDSVLNNAELLANYQDAVRISRGEAPVNRLSEMASSYGGMQAGMTGATSLGTAAGATGSTAAASAASYAALPLAVIRGMDLSQDALYAMGLGEVADEMSNIRELHAKPFTTVGDALGSNMVGDVFRGIGGAVAGIDEGDMRRYGSAIAGQKAAEDLRNQYKDFLERWNFENRAAVADTESTRARTEGLRSLLTRLG